MTHTPKPWRAEKEKWDIAIIGSDEEYIAYVPVDKHILPEESDNALLIAAAPQLLAVLERSVELIDVIMAYAENTPSPVVLNAATIGQEIEQALAATKGQDNG